MEEKVVYEPPDDRAIDIYAQEVCHEISKEHNQGNLSDSEVVYGLSNFLKLIARITVNHLNQGK